MTQAGRYGHGSGWPGRWPSKVGLPVLICKWRGAARTRYSQKQSASVGADLSQVLLLLPLLLLLFLLLLLLLSVIIDIK